MSRILINQYRRDLETRKRFSGSHNENSLRFAFANLLNSYCKSRDFVLVGEGLGVRANQKFIEARDKFLKICQESINPDINIDDVREMIIQHILTEDIFNNIFSEGQFHQENNIAKQLNEVIQTFFTGNVKRNTFKTIQSYYNAIIHTASSIVNHQEKQKFLKVVYENFYKAYNPKEADRLGIVYTPNEIVKFMVESTDYLLLPNFPL